MGFLFTGVFWGLVLIFWGLSLIIEKIFKIKIPLMRYLLAFIIIWVGINLLFFRSCSGRTRRHVLSKSHPSVMVVSKGNRNPNTNIDMNEYNSVFASNTYDLTTYDESDKGVVINSVFGSTDVLISSEKAYDFNVSSVFGVVTLPENYKTGDGAGDPNVITVDINSVFGYTTVKVKDVETTRASERVAPTETSTEATTETEEKEE